MIDLNKEIKKQEINYNGHKFFLPDYSNSIINIKDKILKINNESNKIVVFAFDSINIFQFKNHFENKINIDDMEILSSVYPTGSPTAFSSIFFGKAINQHGIYGIAFYSQEYDGIFQTNKDCIVDSYNKTLKQIDLIKNNESFLKNIQTKKYYIHTNHFWYDSNLWKSFAADSNVISLKPGGHYKQEYDRKKDLFAILLKTEELIKDKKDKFIWSSIDFDEFMHRNGVNTEITQDLLKDISDKISSIVNENPEYNFVFLSDHGQIDLKDNYPFDFDKIIKDCYTNRGGLGRTSYFYSKNEHVGDLIKNQIQNTGLVLNKKDPLLKKIFGFEPSNHPEIGDYVALATKKSFPSYGWNFKAEHGSLSKEELFVPYLHIKSVLSRIE